PRLHFHGRMSYKTRNKLLALSTDRTYQQTIRQLYLLSHQFTTEVLPIKTETQTANTPDDARSTVEPVAQATMPLPELPLMEEEPLLRYKVDDKVKGVVLNIQEHGVLIEIEPEVKGFVHKSKMWGYVAHVEDVVQHGEEVTVRSLSIDLEKRRLELSMQVSEHDRLLYYEAGDIVQGIVTEVVDYGAFVEIDRGVSGLVYKDDMPRHV